MLLNFGMIMKFRNLIFSILFIFFFNNEVLRADKIDLDNKFIPLKDFIILKFDLFLKKKNLNILLEQLNLYSNHQMN